ncbi:MAG: hypothetical protein IPK82_20525 [Polyangiaceae bacterium]|nr:hypothetical protein [Polyangiaceae bacterium]
MGLTARNRFCVHIAPALLGLRRVHNWETLIPNQTRAAQFQFRKHPAGSQVPNSAMLLANPNAAQSVLRPLCLLLGLAADCHVGGARQRRVWRTLTALIDGDW